MDKSARQYIAIDLKSFYASVECVDRGLDPLTTNLVVADKSRTQKTICLAVSPSLKQYGIGGRARLFEVEKRVREVNYERWRKTRQAFRGKSWDDWQLKACPELELDYIVAPPRMSHYIEVSTQVYKTYLKYIAPEDIHVYSIDEVFIDATAYLKTYKMSVHDLAKTMIRDVLKTTGITATAGIGTNMYLCKVAMDIVAKHAEPDADGVRIGELDERSYREKLWNHRPLTAFWRVGKGIAARLAPYGIDTMGKIARLSIENEDLLYHLFGVNAELLIDHAWGWEPCTIEEVKAYKPENCSFSSGQVLKTPYDAKRARVVVAEMADDMALNLVEKKMVTKQLVITVGYDAENLTNPDISMQYNGTVRKNYYGKEVPLHAHGTTNLEEYTSASSVITKGFLNLFDKYINPVLLIRRINLTVANVYHEDLITQQKAPIQLDLFTDYEALRHEEEQKKEKRAKERRMQEAQLNIKKRYGKNAILKGTNFEEGATARERNQQIGGHKA